MDIGGTKIAAGLVTDRGAVLRREQAPTPARQGRHAVVDTVTRLARELGLDGVAAVGVGTAGVVDPGGRTIVGATDAIRDWAGTPLARLLEAALGVPVVVRNDVQAFLAGELAVSTWRTALGVTVGTGIGGAVAVDGVVVRGAHGAAGHLGHVPVPEAEGLRCACGGTGHVEAVAGGPAMTARLEAVSGHGAEPDDLTAPPEADSGHGAEPPATTDPLEATGGRGAGAGARVDGCAAGREPRDLRWVLDRARAGDERAREVLALGGAALGRALAGVVNVVDPEAVIIAGGVLAAGERYLAPLRSALAAGLLPALAGVPVLRARLGDDAVLVGAALDAAATPSGAGARRAGS
ncbi:ROK family protein [Nonomuraea deserti]|uniref:ROK family protein n=1 Tax=Nonomuraea deserti TaxID=1848322 RepID=A0A4R4VRF0_9ACTN|nr:ROK family protein [Nonomuraea deserti]